MKKYTALLLVAAVLLLAACGVPETPAVPRNQETETGCAQTETTTQETDPIVSPKEEDPDTVVEAEVDFSQLDAETEQGTDAATESTESSGKVTKPTEPTKPTETKPTDPADQDTTETATEADGYYDIVIKP